MNFKVSDKIKNLIPYKPGQSEADVKKQYKRDFFVKLASNESPLGPSKSVKDAIAKELNETNIYPDPICRELRSVAAEYYGVSPESVVAGNGSNELIDLIIRIFCEPGESVLTSKGAFIAYKVCTQSNRAELKEMPLRADFSIDLKAFSDFLNKTKGTAEFPRVVFIPNPNNPTGSYIPKFEVEEFLKEWGDNEDIVIVFDEAYTEFVEAADFPDLKTELSYKNVLVLKTMSKVFGLAGLRLGFVLGNEEVLGLINRVRNPFNVNSLAQVAGVAALKDEKSLQTLKGLLLKERAAFSKFLTELGLEYVSSQANFIFFDTGRNALSVHEEFLTEGLIARPLVPYGFKNHLRITIGDSEQMEFAKKVFEKVFSKDKK